MQHVTLKLSLAALVSTLFVMAVACGSAQRTAGEGDRLPRDDLRAIIANTSDVQQRALADGVVTDTEYEAAVLATASCIEESGFSASIVQHGWRMRITGGAVASLDAAKKWGTVQRECADRYSDDIESVYAFQHRPTEQELQAGRERALACMREQGLEANDYDLVWETRKAGKYSAEEQSIVASCMSVGFNGGP